MKFSSTTRAKLRLAIVAIGLVPVALLARALYSGHLTELVQRGWARAWQRYDKSVRDGGAD